MSLSEDDSEIILEYIQTLEDGMKKMKINAKNWKMQMTYCGIMTMKSD